MRFVLMLTALLAHLLAAPASAKTPAACRGCLATCASDVSACIDVAAASCPTAPRGKAKRCLKKAKRHCRRDIKGCCVDACTQSGTPVCCGGASTTSTTQPSSGGNPCFTDGGDGTVHDSCTGLQWEKKAGSRGVHVPGDLHNINDVYPWAGTCARNFGQLCQPDAASAATCTALADGGNGTTAAEGCAECPGGVYDAATNPSGTGPCIAAGSSGAPLTTVWVWLNRVNAANFAGHNDWRLPSQAARNSCPPGEPNCVTTATPRELETILRGVAGSCSAPCSYPIFGVPVASQTWSCSTNRADARYAWLVNFFAGTNEHITKGDGAVAVRAVRTEQ